MSGWDTSSRPTWDPQEAGSGESTQAFGVPGFPEDGGFPSSSSPGTPPAIFLQDYDRGEGAANDGAQNYNAQYDAGQQDSARRGYRREEDPGQRGYGQRGPEQPDYQRQDNPRQDSPRQDYPRQDYPRQESARQDYPWQGGPRQDNARQDNARQDSQWRSDQRQSAARDQLSRDFPEPEQLAPRRRPDPDVAARMDPALRDFFSPSRGYQDQGRRTGGQPAQPGPVQANGNRQPGSGFRDAPPNRWDSAPQRPGSRSERHHQQQNRSEGGGRSAAVIAIAVVLVVAIAVGAYLVLRGKPSTPAAQSGPTTTPTASTPAKSASPTTSTHAGTTTAAGYTLKAPAKAAGYAKLATIPTAVQTAASTPATAIRQIAVTAGGKVASTVTAAYQLSGGQVLAFTGFNGTFDPAKVIAGLGASAHTAAAGPHGGKLACYTTPASPSGTVCVWATTKTLGITEFFSSTGPEVVTDQSKAAADTLSFRASVETRKTA